jgi:hypothetical protein
MKFNCGPTWQEKRELEASWHPWFAWYPVRVGSHDCRWLEVIERKGTWNGSRYNYAGCGLHWEYRAS